MTEENLMYVDCHCHLADKDFDKDIDQVISDARLAGVRAALVVATGVGEFEKVIQLSDRFPDFVVPCLGVHPVQGALTGDQRCVTLADLEEAVPLIEQYHERLGAIGEIGLDFQPRITKTPEDKDVQREVLCKQIDLAKKYNLPINVHSRSAGRPTLTLLKEQGVKNALLHAFDGNPKYAMEGVRQGYFFSMPPSIVRSEQVRNVPQNIGISCKYIAEVKKMNIKELCQMTTENAVKLFPKLAKFVVK